ncbi:hypothetical protein KEH51_25600 [[Brevibacterium] frigoritolerans]|uniref:Uncharacterized protein n=1 Tax=Peribacillus frigoritolerans TaxID=450367 RepID=A0A941J8V0_9BACI|nr:hypothetical protein [Peribacillus frigoritolerans]
MIGTKGTRLLRKNASKGRPHRRKERRGGSRTARGKRVPRVENNVRILQTLKKNVPVDFMKIETKSLIGGIYIFNGGVE